MGASLVCSLSTRPVSKGVEGLARVGSRAALSFAFAFLRRAWRSGKNIAGYQQWQHWYPVAKCYKLFIVNNPAYFTISNFALAFGVACKIEPRPVTTTNLIDFSINPIIHVLRSRQTCSIKNILIVLILVLIQIFQLMHLINLCNLPHILTGLCWWWLCLFRRPSLSALQVEMLFLLHVLMWGWELPVLRDWVGTKSRPLHCLVTWAARRHRHSKTSHPWSSCSP